MAEVAAEAMYLAKKQESLPMTGLQRPELRRPEPKLADVRGNVSRLDNVYYYSDYSLALKDQNWANDFGSVTGDTNRKVYSRVAETTSRRMRAQSIGCAAIGDFPQM